jgi:hypothetical protein
MKKLFTLISAISIVSSVNAQTPVKESVSLVTKITGVKCPPCGGWGWTMANDLIAQTEGKAHYMGVVVPFGGSNALSCPTSIAMQGNLASPGWGGIPDFAVNSVGLTSQSANTNTFLSAVNTFNATTPVASVASLFSFSGNTATATSKVQFWDAAEGDYYLAAYLVEDGVKEIQAGRSGIQDHHYVLRGSMSGTAAFGESIINGAATANQTIDKSFTFNITESSWDKNNMWVYTVIWKKVGSKYEYVNMNATKAGVTSINDLTVANSFQIYPNPTTNNLHILFEAKSVESLSYSVTNILGQEVLNLGTTPAQVGKNATTLDVSSLASGIYILNVKSEKGSVQHKFTKN